MTDTRTLTVVDACSSCEPLTRETLSAESAVELARGLKALADPARLRLMSIVAASVDKESSVCDLTEPLGLSQPTVSHHLKVLADAGFLERTQRGTSAYYSIVPGALDSVSKFLVTD